MASTPSSGPESATSAISRAPRSAATPKLTCLCAPTSHPGSFRCSRHRTNPAPSGEPGGQRRGRTRSVRALLLQKIASPSGQRGRRRGDFQPRPSRLRLMNK